MAVVREREDVGTLGASSILDTLGLTDAVNQLQSSLNVTTGKANTMMDGITDLLPLTNVTLIVTTISLSALAIFAFLDFMDLNPFRRK